ncbi:hypothetical protein [Pseudanabaena sp. 'Roaring Creek']|uniref:hypothetical protein n=1 Tax=Pseudanabaena sp. 'Roaring Creek' TaxID=1681830 RepID=UPI0006D7634F|nr:hypothetical protein [Pseudanabaena sp. 'Roaring Creek']
MASGTSRYKYKTDKGNIFYARTDNAPELQPIRGAEPVGNVTESITFEFSKNAKEVGMKPRSCILKLKGTQSATGCLISPNSITKRVIVLDPATVLPQQGSEITVNGRVWIVSSISSEHAR